MEIKGELGHCKWGWKIKSKEGDKRETGNRGKSQGIFCETSTWEGKAKLELKPNK